MMMELEVLSYDTLKCKTDLKGLKLVIVFVTMRDLAYLGEPTIVTITAEEVVILITVEESAAVVVVCFLGK